MTRFEDPPAWVADAVFYQIFPDRFALSDRVEKPGPLEAWDAPPTHHGFKGGDLLGVVEHLDYLSELGINALYLTPIFASASNHRYHTYDYYRVDPLLGGDEALRELLDACHARAMRVVLDGVFNHSGRGFWPFHHVVENGVASPYVDWFHLDLDTVRARGLRPYPTRDDVRRMEAQARGFRDGTISQRELGYRAWWDLPALPKLNTDNPHMREHLLGAAEHWLRFGIDGWRLDVAEEVDSGFWREFRTRVRAVNPDAYIVAEIWREKPDWLTGDTFDALMNYPLVEALLSFVAARHLDAAVVRTQHEYSEFVRPMDGPAFAARLEHLVSMYPAQNVSALLNLLGSHDTARYLTVAGGDVASLKLAMLALMTLPGAPCIYYGDEIGMEGRHDPDCRRAFPWDEPRWNHDVLDFTRAVVALRHAQGALRHGSYRTLAAAGHAIAYGRGEDDDVAVVAINAGESETTLELRTDDLRGRRIEPISLPAMAQATMSEHDGSMRLTLPARSGGVFVGGRS
ncbi:MAG TPA: glycoside hydrolase family 13 protein [Candidatus Limnocylindrales bacterium]